MGLVDSWKGFVAGFKAGKEAAGKPELTDEEQARLSGTPADVAAEEAAAKASADRSAFETALATERAEKERALAAAATTAKAALVAQHTTMIEDLRKRLCLTPAEADAYLKLAQDQPEAFQATAQVLKLRQPIAALAGFEGSDAAEVAKDLAGKTDAGADLLRKAQEIQRDNPKMPPHQAMIEAAKRNPALSKRYVQQVSPQAQI